ncbi:TIGR03086 family metal-binding protein [Krasilnikovia sp. MM14-A1259]|uniref:TIGR03086 family metal-binding protein n=1 Tax=Krasilnikovia sp. MM14-A1259 TaxID=3373539 RepID=UPI0037FE44A3
MLDLAPAAREVATLLDGVADDQLDDPTPCEDTSVAALLAHLQGLSLAFTWAARKTPPPEGAAPRADAAALDPNWRAAIPQRLDELVAAWRDESAWDGFTQAGGFTLPGDVAGLVALDELVMHGWDLAKATSQPFEPDATSAAAVLRFTEASARPKNAAQREGLFGPVVAVPEDASDFERALGFAGRDPHWQPAAR